MDLIIMTYKGGGGRIFERFSLSVLEGERAASHVQYAQRLLAGGASSIDYEA